MAFKFNISSYYRSFKNNQRKGHKKLPVAGLVSLSQSLGSERVHRSATLHHPFNLPGDISHSSPQRFPSFGLQPPKPFWPIE